LTTTRQPVPGATAAEPRSYRKGSVLADWLSSTDHKVIGHLYLITSFGFFLIAGIMAMIIRAQLIRPDNHLVSDQQYNELFTMHGAIMLLLFATPLFIGFADVRGADAVHPRRLHPVLLVERLRHLAARRER
jgi:cytochrome c oxidase subunit 1